MNINTSLEVLMRTHFLQVNNLQELKNQFKILYITTVSKFREKLDRYALELCALELDALELINDERLCGRSYEIKFFMKELYDTIEQMEEINFMNFFINWIIEFSENVRHITVNGHTDKCITRAIFDIIFKYAFDIDYKISYSCCNTEKFKDLQYEILRDCGWKIF